MGLPRRRRPRGRRTDVTPVAIGVDVGGTKIAGALIGADGTATRESTIPTPHSAEGADPGAAATTSLVSELLASARADGRPIVAVGLGVPEYVTPDGSIASAEVLAWGPEDLDAMRSPVEVIVDSDVRCAARAEWVVGLGDRFDSFLFVSIGTGISHTFFLEDRLVAGHRGEAIALGEFPVDPDAALRADAPLTVESQASGRAIEQHLEACRSGGLTPASSDEVGVRAGRIVGAAIAAAVGLVDPQAVILGGGLGSSSGPYTESLIAEAERLLARRPHAPTAPPGARRSYATTRPTSWNGTARTFGVGASRSVGRAPSVATVPRCTCTTGSPRCRCRTSSPASA